MTKTSVFQRMISVLVCVAMVLSCIPGFGVTARGAIEDMQVVEGSKKADPATIDGWEAYFGPDKLDTEFAGAVWTDKSVFAAENSKLPGVTLTDRGNFLVALSAIASNLSVTGHTSAPTDTMLVLDLSGSMVDDTYEVGTVRWGNQYRTAEAIDMSLIDAMIQATNATIASLMEQNTNNRVGVVLYSGNTASNQAATPSTARVVLPLGRYTGVDGQYLSVDTTYTTQTLYARQGWSWTAIGEATYVPEDTDVDVSVKDGLKTEAGANVPDTSKQVVGGTYIQNGLYQAMEQFLDVTDTTVPEGRPQAGAARIPVLVLMSDGAPTIATTSYNEVGNSNVGDGTATSDRITFLTQLTAAFARGSIGAHYKKDALVLTLGLGTENSAAATNTLYPAGSNETLVTYWDRYLAGAAGQSVQIANGQGGWSVYRDAAVKAMNYVDKYYYANNAQDLIDSFEQIVSEIALKAGSYATLVESSGADLSGYVTFDDELGELMQVYNVGGILLGDTLFTGRELARGMNAGDLGTVADPNERGDELVATVKERIPGTSTTQAQQLIGNAHNDRQLYHENDSSWSNYIGWYADADGKYVGFWDKDSGYENAPDGAVYANKSYGYLGVNGDSDMMHVVVMVRTDLKTLHQTVVFRVPASLLPTVQYSVTLEQDDPDSVKNFVRKDAAPIRLVYEVGVREDLNAVNMEAKIAEHVAKGGHVHRNADGTVTFYTNEWAIGNDKNNNGIPDPEEVDSAIVTQSHFHPALDNGRFYYTEDTVILTGNDAEVTSAARPAGDGYYYHRYIYSSTGRQTIHTPIARTTLEKDAAYDSENGRWYIPAGTMYQNLSRFQTPKTANTTGTLGYSFFPAVFDAVGKQDVYTFLGNNGAVTVAPAQGIALTKTVSETSDDPNAPTEFTFTVTLSQAVEPAVTDVNGQPLENIATVSGNVVTVKLTAGQTVLLTGIPTGTTYTVEEVTTQYYTASSANATGAVSAHTVHAVDFVNTAKQYGALVVGKDVNYPAGFVPGTAHNAVAFTIYVDFTGDISGITAPAGAVQNGNRFTLTLKDGQSATFSNIPAGVTYAVTEEAPTGGYGLQEIRYSDQNKTVNGKDLDEVHVVNGYTLLPVSPNVQIRGDKTLVTNDSSWGGEEFLVELQQQENPADQGFVTTGITATMTEADPSYRLDLSSLPPLDHAGTYYYRVVELIPANRNENIAYDRTFGLFSITVTDENADGQLEVKEVNALQSTEISGDAASGWVLEKDFTNVVTTDRVYLNIQKHVTDASSGAVLDVHMGEITFGLFSAMTDTTPAYYGMTDPRGQAQLMIPVTKDAITAAGGAITYYLREIAPALTNRVVGMHYDESWRYAIEISWDDVQNAAVVRYAPMENGAPGAYVPYDGAFVFEHTNTYEQSVAAELDLTGRKTLNGQNALGGREFSFSLYKASAAFVKGDKLETVKNSGNTISFNDISFTAPGVYYLVAEEEASTLGGITIDATQYHITVEVEKYVDSEGVTRLRMVDGYPTVVAFGTTGDVGKNGLNFNNRYTVTGEGSVTIGGEKKLTGRSLAAEEFEIGLYEDAACTQLIEKVSNRADGTFSFGTITYTVADLGENLSEKTYTYYVKEIPGGKGGVTYDDTAYPVTVTVSHTDGVLVVTPSGNATTLQIRNTYKADNVTVRINGKKELSGDWTAVTNRSFTFHLYRADEDFTVTDTDPVKSVTVTGSESFTISRTYQDGDEGTYYYVLKEDISNRAGGIGYDAGEYHITVNISDPGNGQLVANSTVYRPGSGNTNTAVFTNTYSVAPTQITLEGEKTYKHGLTQQDLPMEEGDYTFLVLEGANLAATGYNKADGTIVFTPITYTAAGEHTYTVVEEQGDKGGVIYDETEFTVVVTVTDDGAGNLSADADYGANPVVFANKYDHEAAQVTFTGEKHLSGDWSAVPQSRKEFTFSLYETGANFTVTGDPVDSYTGAAGAYSFGARTYTAEGTHYYVLLEEAGVAGKGITYAKNRYHITVEVEDNGAGKLIPTVTCQQSGVTVTADPANAGEVTVGKLDFTNTYTPTPAQYTPVANKSYEGDEMKEFDFVLTVDGNERQVKQNDGNTVTFDTLSFPAPGVYELTIREQENILWGLIRWDTNVYTITLHVQDNGDGRLYVNESKTTVESPKGTDDLLFRNTHHSVITKKDVFAAEAPTVSIDGKKVETGDVLLYKISFTNYDSVPVAAQITDTIPQHTRYVEASADRGGKLVGDTLRWKLDHVAPGATITVSFRVEVTEVKGDVTNQATVAEGNNTYQTNKTVNPVTEDKVQKDVFAAEKATVSVDGQKVETGDELVYTITYTNTDDLPAEVIITDTIPENTDYVYGSADNGGVYSDGVITWTLELSGGQSKTVSFKVKVTAGDVTVTNRATAAEGNNKLDTNQTTTPVEKPAVEGPVTGDNSAIGLWFGMMAASATALFVLILSKKKQTA